MDKDHFKVSNMKEPYHRQPPYDPLRGAVHEPPYLPPSEAENEPVWTVSAALTGTIAKWLILGASMALLTLNFAMGIILVLDMASGEYDPYTHYFMTIAFSLTIGVLAFIHNWMMKN